MDILPYNDYNKRLDKRIKDAFTKKLNLNHPCIHQDNRCLKGSSCPLIALPTNACVYFIRGKCKFNKCPYTHDEELAKIYRTTKEQFRLEENEPLALFKRYFKYCLPFLISFIGLFFNYFVRKFFDYTATKIF